MDESKFSNITKVIGNDQQERKKPRDWAKMTGKIDKTFKKKFCWSNHLITLAMFILQSDVSNKR